MQKDKAGIIHQNKIFLWLALATGAILLVPFLAMQFNITLPDPGSSSSDRINWAPGDFIVMGALLFGVGSLYVGISRVTPRKHHAFIGVGATILVLYLWAELAVGIFTNWGS